MNNPLLKFFLFPPFQKIKFHHIISAIKFLINRNKNIIKKILVQSNSFTWNNFCQPLFKIDNDLQKVFSVINHLHSVTNTQEIRKTYKESLLLITNYNSWLQFNQNLYESYKKFSITKNYLTLNIFQKKSIDKILKNFELNGISLSSSKKNYCKKIINRLHELYLIYNNNVLDSTEKWNKLIIDKENLTGLPKDLLKNLFLNAKLNNQKGWLITLHPSLYSSIIKYCENRDLRKEIYYAYNTRASEIGLHHTKLDNTEVINEILLLRHNISNLLNFKSYAHKSLKTKTVKDPSRIFKFMKKIASKIHFQGKEEFQKLCKFAKKKLSYKKIYPWDISYCSEKQRQYMLSINSKKMRNYFSEKKVINGLFKITNKIYDINIKESNNTQVWHPDVKFFNIFNKKKILIGSFYLDLYFRKNKQSGAWMSDYTRKFRQKNRTIQKPIVFLVCNFNKSKKNNKILYDHESVVTLFHEFGHCLHHVLNNNSTYGTSGIYGVPLDAIEITSQLMENYCWQYDSIKLITEHCVTKKPIPKKLIIKLLKAKTYQSSLFLLRQLEFSLFDILIHLKYRPRKKNFLLESFLKIKKNISVLPYEKWERFPNTFSHIFSNEYSAGYYSYLLSNILSKEIWFYFKKNGFFNKKIGNILKNSFISLLGSKDPIHLTKKFCHINQPTTNSFFSYYKIKNNNNYFFY